MYLETKKRPYPPNNYAAYRNSSNPYKKSIHSLVKEKLPSCFTCEETEQFKGKWREFFKAQAEQKLHLELGSYHGEALIEMAKKNPQELFIGIDWKFKESYKAAQKAIQLQLKNIVFLRANMARLTHIFSPKEIDQVWILFPDPWPKLPQQKWRVMHKDFFSLLAYLLEEGKQVLIKTDHSHYASSIYEELEKAKYFNIIRESLTLEELFHTFPTSPYEKIFLKNNAPIFSFPLVRNGNKVVFSTPMQEILQSSVT